MSSPDFDDKPDDRPPMSEDSQVVVLLRDVANQLRMSRTEAISIAGGNPGKMNYLQPPRTAMEAADQRRKRRDHLTLAAQLLPHKREKLLEQLEAESR